MMSNQQQQMVQLHQTQQLQTQLLRQQHDQLLVLRQWQQYNHDQQLLQVQQLQQLQQQNYRLLQEMMTQQQVLRGQVDPCQLEQHDQQVSIL
jgi:hypothetical protein